MWRSFLIVSNIFLLSCGGNSFETFADKTDDDALYYTALLAINDRSWSTAINACTEMSTGFLDKRNTRMVCASAYAGRCGFETLEMIEFVEDYASSGAPPTNRLLSYAIDNLTGTTAQDLSDCKQAESFIRGIGVAANRTSDENIFLTLLEIHLLGLYANATADADEAGANDGVVDAGFNACTDIDSATASGFAQSYWELNKSVAAIATTNQLFDDLSTAISGVCTALNTYNTDYNLCSPTAFPTSPTTDHQNAARMIVHEGALIGVNSCNTGTNTFLDCGCP